MNPTTTEFLRRLPAPEIKPDGQTFLHNLTETTVLKPSAGLVYRVTVLDVGTDGHLTLNNASTLEGANANNRIFNARYSDLKSGMVIVLKWLCAEGIVLSSVPTGGAVSISLS